MLELGDSVCGTFFELKAPRARNLARLVHDLAKKLAILQLESNISFMQ